MKFVFGNGQTPSLVLKYCETFEERSVIHSLGIHFGVPEWQQDFMKKFEFVQSHDEEQEEAVDTVKNEVETNLKKLEKSPHQVEKVFAIIEFLKLMKMTEILWNYNRSKKYYIRPRVVFCRSTWLVVQR